MVVDHQFTAHQTAAQASTKTMNKVRYMCERLWIEVDADLAAEAGIHPGQEVPYELGFSVLHKDTARRYEELCDIGDKYNMHPHLNLNL